MHSLQHQVKPDCWAHLVDPGGGPLWLLLGLIFRGCLLLHITWLTQTIRTPLSSKWQGSWHLGADQLVCVRVSVCTCVCLYRCASCCLCDSGSQTCLYSRITWDLLKFQSQGDTQDELMHCFWAGTQALVVIKISRCFQFVDKFRNPWHIRIIITISLLSFEDEQG